MKENKFLELINNNEAAVDVNEQTFRGESIQDKKLSCSVFYKIEFVGMVFKSTDLTGCSFIECTFINCLFENVSLHKSDFSDTEVKECTFSDCQYTRSDLNNVNFLNVQLDKINFSWSYFNECNFKNSILNRLNLTGAIISDSLFESTKHEELEIDKNSTVKVYKDNQLVEVAEIKELCKLLE